MRRLLDFFLPLRRREAFEPTQQVFLGHAVELSFLLAWRDLGTHQRRRGVDLGLVYAIDCCEWWRGRGQIAAKTANKDIGQLSRMFKERVSAIVSIRATYI